MSAPPLYGSCPYCGQPSRIDGTCTSCADLKQLDPLAAPARRPLTERQLGIRDPNHVTARAGRRELYRR